MDYSMLILLAATFVTHMTAALNLGTPYEILCTGEIAYPVINNCRQYFICLDGTLTLRTCPGINEFSPIYKWCLPPKIAKCSHKYKQHVTGECIDHVNLFPPSVKSQSDQYHANNPKQESINEFTSTSKVKPATNPEVESTTPVELMNNTIPKSKSTTSHESVTTTHTSVTDTLKVGKVTESRDTLGAKPEKSTARSSEFQHEINIDSRELQFRTGTSVENSTSFSPPINPKLNVTESDNTSKTMVPVTFGVRYTPNLVENHSTSDLLTPIGRTDEIFSKPRFTLKTSPAIPSTLFEFDNSSTILTTDSNFGLNKLIERSSLSTDGKKTCNTSLELCDNGSPCNVSSLACQSKANVITLNQPSLSKPTTLNVAFDVLLIPTTSASKCDPFLTSCDIIPTKENESTFPKESFSPIPNFTMSVDKNFKIVTHLNKLTTVSNLNSITQSLATTETKEMNNQNQNNLMTNPNESHTENKFQSDVHSNSIWKTQSTAKTSNGPSRTTRMSSQNSSIFSTFPTDMQKSSLMFTPNTNFDEATKKPNETTLFQNEISSTNDILLSIVSSTESATKSSDILCDKSLESCLTNSTMSSTSTEPTRGKSEPLTTATSLTCNPTLRPCKTSLTETSTISTEAITSDVNITSTKSSTISTEAITSDVNITSTKISTISTETITSDVNITELPEVACPDNQAQSDPNNCKKFYLCLKNTLFHIDCPENTEFDPLKKWCLPTHLAQCTLKDTSLKVTSTNFTSSSTEPSQTILTLSPQSLEPTVSSATEEPYTVTYCQEMELYPNPENCQQYYICENNTLVIRSCPGTMEFSFSYRRCMPAESADCKFYKTAYLNNKNKEIVCIEITKSSDTQPISNSNLDPSDAVALIKEVYGLRNITLDSLPEESSEEAIETSKYFNDGHGQSNINKVKLILQKLDPATILINNYLDSDQDSSEEESSENSEYTVYSELSDNNQPLMDFVNHILQINDLTDESVSTGSQQSSFVQNSDEVVLPIYYMSAKPSMKVNLTTPKKTHPMFSSNNTSYGNNANEYLSVFETDKSGEANPRKPNFELTLYSVDKYKSILHSYFCYEKVTYPNPNDCSKYYKCKFGSLVSLDCPNGEKFSEIDQKCLPAHKVGCLYKSQSNTDQEKLLSRRLGGSNLKHENYKTIPTSDVIDCRYYFVCNTELCTRKKCPDGLMFSRNEKKCVSFALSGCWSNYIRKNTIGDDSDVHSKVNFYKTKENRPYLQINVNNKDADIVYENQDSFAETADNSLNVDNIHRYKRKSAEKIRSKLIDLLKKQSLKDDNKVPQENDESTTENDLQTTSVKAIDDIRSEKKEYINNTDAESIVK